MQIPEILTKEFAALPANFFGSIELSIQNGQPVVIKITATKKIHTERDNRANGNGNQSR